VASQSTGGSIEKQASVPAPATLWTEPAPLTNVVVPGPCARQVIARAPLHDHLLPCCVEDRQVVGLVRALDGPVRRRLVGEDQQVREQPREVGHGTVGVESTMEQVDQDVVPGLAGRTRREREVERVVPGSAVGHVGSAGDQDALQEVVALLAMDAVLPRPVGCS